MRRALAFAKRLADHRRAGGRVGLLVVSLHDWQAGLWFEGAPEVFRVVLPDDLSVDTADWSVCLALDVLICGSADDAVFNAVVRGALEAGAVSAWGDFNNGVHRLEVLSTGSVIAVDGPFPLAELGAALQLFRPAALALRIGGYGSRVFDAVRSAMFGALLAELQGALVEVG